mmetsp:Transcript_27216/g.78484  ORF Transcript_27216/g.78484 Transcript_27216/m.78484 type:complete len:225 (+) Transcript_27216:78-752(+)|eukprot:CAMPEP_0181042174 /NCGR_PEP_ID=MMETSP1070-20121207/12004_1 /TAXON_ID=265543 /ORGANISM="Minutocellus polymorphus, Strain NH13" /LENGTH=224 /DNA_ID=CAMNT_0023120359 /DNA_START=71 /DNA_END=745 /DNA_ORIENTATION=-
MTKASAQPLTLALLFLGVCLLPQKATAFIAGAGGIQRQRQSASTFSSPSPSALFNSVTWNNGNSYGKGEFRFYKNFDEWMKPFPAEDRELYPDMFRIPDGVYEVRMAKPLGIVFEEFEAGGGGVFVAGLVEGGNAEARGIVQPGDKLIGVTAIKVIGAKWERRLLPCGTWDFDTVVGAIGSNDVKWGCDDVVLQFERPGEAKEEEVKKHLDFFEPPFASSWKRG